MACEPNRARLLCMLSLTFGFFVVEVVVSRITASLSMLSDSFHMLSDVIALVVALVAVRFAEKTQATNKNTFGWIRAEVMGALVNAVFLTALCFTIVLEAIERFTEAHEIESPVVLVGVGAAGLVINLLGLCLFHGHAGGGHGHSHGGKKSKGVKHQKTGNATNGDEANHLVGNHCNPGDTRPKNDISLTEGAVVHVNGAVQREEPEHERDASQLNMRGVFLHVLGDALGSVIVVINAIIFIFVWQPCEKDDLCINPCVSSHDTDHQHVNNTLVGIDYGSTSSPLKVAGPCWVLYLDPTLCLIMVCILLYTTFPLLKESALILLQTVPKQINIHQLSDRLLGLEGVLAIHELHVWQLAGSRIIATAHIKCRDPTSYMDVAKSIKDIFHDEGIHATTIQPEFVTFNSESRDSLCELSCRTQCAPKLCCGAGDKLVQGSDKRGDYKPPLASALEVVVETPDHAATARDKIAQEAESSL